MSTRCSWTFGAWLVVSACGGQAVEEDSALDHATKTQTTDPAAPTAEPPAVSGSDAVSMMGGSSTAGARNPDGTPANGGGFAPVEDSPPATTPATTNEGTGGASLPASDAGPPQPPTETDPNGTVTLAPLPTQPAVSAPTVDAGATPPDSTAPDATAQLDEPPCGTTGCSNPMCEPGTELFPTLDGLVCLKVCTASGGTLTLDTPASVSALAQQQCEVIDGSVVITGASVESLVGLETIRRIAGSLVVQETTALNDLDGLTGVEEIGGNIVLESNTGLTTVEGLGSMKRVQNGMVAVGNPALVDFRPLGNATFAEAAFTLANNDALLSLDGLDGATDVPSLVIASNHSLTSTAGLHNLSTLGNMTLTDNTALKESIFPALTSAESMTIAGNTELSTFSANSVSAVSSIILSSNAALVEVGLDALQTADFLTIADQPVLQSIGGLPNLREVNDLYLTLNPMLSQCTVDEIAARVGGCADCSGNDGAIACE